MKNALKGALWSGVVLPGLGQIVMGHYLRGAVIMLTATASLVAIIVGAAQQAISILEKMTLEDGIIGMDAVSEAVRASTRSEGLTSGLAWLLLILCWIIGIADAYRIGRKKDMEEGPVLGADHPPPEE